MNNNKSNKLFNFGMNHIIDFGKINYKSESIVKQYIDGYLKISDFGKTHAINNDNNVKNILSDVEMDLTKNKNKYLKLNIKNKSSLNFDKYNNDKMNQEYNYPSQDDKVYTSLKLLTTLSKDYKLLVKVTSKGEIKQYRNGKGKLFSFVIMDELGNKMQVVGFDKVADKFVDEISENNIYEITGGYIRTADKRFDPPGSDYKLILNESSVITKKNEDEKNFKDKFEDPDNKFWTLNEIKEAPINTIANVVCVVGDKGETNYKDTKSGSILIRKLFVLDQSNEKMELTLWRNLTQLNINNGDILVCKKVRVNDFGGKNLTSTTESKIYINPIITDFPEISKEIQSLKIFSEQNELNKGINPENKENKETPDNKKEIIVNNININNKELNNKLNNNNPTPKKEFNDKIVYIDTILEEMNKYILTDFDHRFPFYKIRATVTHLGHTEKNFYPGCPNRECNRKLTFSNGDWICQSCRQSFKTPRYYYSLNIRVKDCSSEYWIDIFGKPAEMIMNINADDYRNILVNRDEEKLGQISEGVEYKEFYFLLKVRLNKFNDTTKKKFTATKIEKINKKENTGKLVSDIKNKLGIN